MRMMMKVSIPAEAGNKAIKDGSLPKVIMGFMEKAKPESAYFTAEGGKRMSYFVFDLKDPTYIPALAEPFFMGFNAEIDLKPVMNSEELKAGLDKASQNF